MLELVELKYIDRSKKYRFLQPILKEPWAMLLDSGSDCSSKLSANAESYRRFDILVFKPTIKLQYDDQQFSVSSADNTPVEITNSSPLIVMKELLANYKNGDSITATNDIPFTGGWLGYISYDFGLIHSGALREKKEKAHNIPLIQMGLYQSALITDHKKKTTRIYNFGLPSEKFSAIKSRLTQSIDDSDIAKQENNKDVSSYSLLSPFTSNMSKNQYADGFDKIQNYIYDGDCYQVNFSQQFTSTFEGKPLAIYEKLAKANNAPFSAYLNFGGQKILSLSPERFIESHQGQVRTQPIKGTRPRGTTEEQDKSLSNELLNSEKDRAENLMIVDLLRNDLSKTASKGSVEVKELFGLYRFESVHHLISTITSTLKPEYDAFDLLATSLPGGSITGAPKIRAMQIIDELEPVERGIYCGIIGYIDFNGNMDTNICIRTLVIDNNHIVCSAGGGLVADSHLDLEYQETFDKLNKIIPILEENLNFEKT
jgi:para-aminobenzoate synthetase component 1